MSIIPILPPSSTDKDYTITFPKEMVPYLESFFYPQKKKANETLEEYIVRAVINYGQQVLKDEFKQLEIKNVNETVEQNLPQIDNEVDTLVAPFL